MPTYAAKTEVNPDRRRAEIEHTLERYGATHFGYLNEPGRATIACQIHGRRLRFVVPLPKASDYRTQAQHQQAIRQRWAALALIIKAKLEAVEIGLAPFDQIFAADVLLPSGETAGEQLARDYPAMFKTGELPPLLAGATERPKIIELPSGREAK